MAAVPPLFSDLAAAVDLDPSQAAAIRGPRLWWCGPLDVEGLALGSAQAAATGLSHLTGRDLSVDAERVAASFASISHLRVNGRRPQTAGALSGFHATADGWVRLHGNYPHHARAIERALGASDPQRLTEVLSRRRALEVEQRVRDAGGVAAAVRTPESWARSTPGRAAARGPWLRFQSSGIPVRRWAPPEGGGDAPLLGLRVLDLTRVIAGPSASRLLGALGADVLRVDPPSIPELRGQHLDTGFHKRSVVLDLRNRRGLQTLQRLLDDAHVLLLGYRGGALSRFGVEDDQPVIERPGLRVVRLSAWGSAGPWAGRRGFDCIVQAASGIAHLYRSPDGAPGALPVQALDHATGMGVVAAVGALLASDHADVAHLSLARTAALLLEHPPTIGPPRHMRVQLRSMRTEEHGHLQFVPPALLLDDRGVEYTQGPGRYGGSEAWFLDRPPGS